MRLATTDRNAAPETPELSALETALLDDYQRGFPLVPRPYAAIAGAFGLTEEEVLAAYEDLLARGFVSRIGAVVRPHRLGWSTLAAMAVPEPDLESVADLVSAYPEVNHNYEREHDLNLWFVVTAQSREEVLAVLAEIAAATGLEVLEMPLEKAYRVDLGFSIR